ncbi:hypothetical protein [Nostoc sp.]
MRHFFVSFGKVAANLSAKPLFGCVIGLLPFCLSKYWSAIAPKFFPGEN